MDLFNDSFTGLVLDKEGQETFRKTITNKDELETFIRKNVEESHELRVMNLNDKCVFHVREQTLLYPVPEGEQAANKWDKGTKKFTSVNIKMS